MTTRVFEATGTVAGHNCDWIVVTTEVDTLVVVDKKTGAALCASESEIDFGAEYVHPDDQYRKRVDEAVEELGKLAPDASEETLKQLTSDPRIVSLFSKEK